MTIFAPQACAQRNIVSDYNYRKAVDAFYDEDDDDKALDLVTKQLDDTPDHLDSRFLRAKIYWRADKYDAALRDVAYAIKHYKGNPSVYKSTLFGLQGAIYDDMKKYEEAAASYNQAAKFAKKDNPERLQSYKFDWAQALYHAGNLDGAEKVYLDMLKQDPGDGGAMVGLARNRRDQKKYEEGLEWLTKAESYDASYAEIYRFRMEILDKMGKIDESVDAALKFFELNDDAPAWLVAEYAGKHYTYGVAKVKAEMNKENASNRWIVLLTRMYEDHSEYAKALELYEKVEQEYGTYKIVRFSHYE